MPTVVLLGTLDTKGVEYAFLRDRLLEHGVDVLLVDAGVNDPSVTPDIGREELRVYRKGAEEQVAMERKSEKGFGWATDLHVQNFLDCVRTRKTPSAPMKLAFQAALVVQMANLSLKNGRRMRWNNAANRVES